VNVQRQREWERNRERDTACCLNRGVPSYDMLNTLMEDDLDTDEVGVEELVRVISVPKFFVSAPTRWELKAAVRWNPDEPPSEVYIGGQVGQRIHAIPVPYQPEDFFDIFDQRAEEAEVCVELSAQEHREALRNIEMAGVVSGELLPAGNEAGAWQAQSTMYAEEVQDIRRIRGKDVNRVLVGPVETASPSPSPSSSSSASCFL